MNGKGRKLFRSAVGILTSVMMMGAYTTTAMASGIGVIDAKDMLDIHAEANTASAVIGQVMEDGHVAILAKYNDWVQIQAGEIKKSLVLDLDNTLWGGIVGDDGDSGMSQVDILAYLCGECCDNDNYGG